MNIVLIGFMGSGKSTIAKLLNKKLNKKLVEMDELIVKKSGRKNINEIFKKDGEKTFRELELRIAKEISQKDNQIVSTGGGVVMNKKTMLYLRKNSIVIYIKAPFSLIRKRIGGLGNRPLFKDVKKAKALFIFRQPLYKRYADIVINMGRDKKEKETASQNSADEICRKLIFFPIKKIKKCIIIGDPVNKSKSPIMHNTAYKKIGLEDEFIFLPMKVKKSELKNVVGMIKKQKIHGITCTIPHKVNIMKYLDEIDPIARNIGAVNTIVNRKGKLFGYNTDWLGAVIPLKKRMSIKNKKVALLGAGGAARAIAYGLVKEKADLKIFNRSVEKARKLADELNCQFGNLDDLNEIKDYDIIINATSVGMAEQENKSPVPKNLLSGKQIIFDIVYIPAMTKLLKDARKNGATIIPGREMLLYQALSQFEIYTNNAAPVKTMEEALFEDKF